MPTYQELLTQIETLKRQAEELRQAEIEGVIADIQQKIKDYGLTAEDIGLAESSVTKKPVAGAAGKRVPVKAKYRDPATGATWSGRGVMPKWLKAEIDGGKDKSTFLIAD